MTDDLGMRRNISRRDLLQAGAAAAALPTISLSASTGASTSAEGARQSNYPPLKTGLRGAHPGSFEAAHELARERRLDWPEPSSDESFDLIVVGAGISGLAAAYFYRRANPAARILILDNHDDFGGHAKRNEFQIGDHRMIGYGGSQSLESPSSYSEVASQLLLELGVDLGGFEQAFDQNFHQRHGLSAKLFFDKSTYGSNVLVPAGFLLRSAMLEIDQTGPTIAETIARMPLTEIERAELLALTTVAEDAIPEIGLAEISEHLSSISYENFLTQDIGIRSDRLLALLRRMPAGYFGIGADAIPALDAMLFGLPGLAKLGVPGAEWLTRKAIGWMVEPYIHHFPDGNASIARGLVRSLIPEIAEGSSAAELVLASFDYAQLDHADHNVQVRLESTAINARNTDTGTEIRYVRDGQTFKASATHSVLACYNMMIPYLCPDLPAAQRQALTSLVKIPLVYSNVALTNWRALKDAGLGFAMTPSAFHDYCMVDFPVSLGGYQFPESPDQPMLLHFSATLSAPGLPPRDQYRAGRARLLATRFEEIELDLRSTLAGMLSDAAQTDFDPARDVAAITVNRWPHGYAYGYNPLFDPDYGPGEAPHEIGRARYGNIAIANSDAGARAYLDEAVDQAHRAVGELLS